MENLFCDRDISNKFDLKGSERNRMVDPTNQNNQNGEIVLLDENLIQSEFSCLYFLNHFSLISLTDYNKNPGFQQFENLITKSGSLLLAVFCFSRTFFKKKCIFPGL